MPLSIAIASYLEPEHVRRIEAVSPEIRVAYDPSLLAPPRFAADHTGRPDFRRTAEGEARFRAMLADAEVHYDFDRALAPQLPTLAPKLKWIQATSSGIGPFVKKAGLDRTDIVITNAAGIHAVPLAEHTLLSLLYFVKDVPARRRDQRAHVWERYAGRELRGLDGGRGRAWRRRARGRAAVPSGGLHVIGVRRSPCRRPRGVHVDEATTPDRLHEVLPRADALVLIAPAHPGDRRHDRRERVRRPPCLARSSSTSVAAPS